MMQVIFIISVLLAVDWVDCAPQSVVRLPPTARIVLRAWRRLICTVGDVLLFIVGIMSVAKRQHFAYHQSMNATGTRDAVISRIAAAIGEPARVRMLYCLLDGRARTS